jgi:hypothetical protein
LLRRKGVKKVFMTMSGPQLVGLLAAISSLGITSVTTLFLFTFAEVRQA